MQFYLDLIRIKSKTVIDGLNEEITNLKREMDKTNQLRLARIKSLEESAQNMMNVFMEQSPKYEELTEFFKLA